MASLCRLMRRAMAATVGAPTASRRMLTTLSASPSTTALAGTSTAAALLRGTRLLTAGSPASALSMPVRHKTYALSATVSRIAVGGKAMANQIVRGEDDASRRSMNIHESGRDAFKSAPKHFKPRTPSLRHTVLIHRPYLWKGRPFGPLTRGMRKTGGRGHKGRVCVRGRGGGHKRRYRFVDFQRQVMDVPGVVQRLEYDPNRSCDIALVLYPDGRVQYIIAPQDVLPGDTVLASKNEIDLVPGNCMPLGKMPIGTVVHNVELKIGEGGVLARSAGTSCELLDKISKPGFALLRLQSKEQRYVRAECMATVGAVSNPLHYLRNLGKAGRSRWLGRRPITRGVARNPVDHPMGGGNGKTSGGRPSCSPWGWPTKGYKTRDRRKASRHLIIVPRGGLAKGMSVKDRS